MENITISFDADTSGLTKAIDLLVKLGQVDQKTADEFKSANKVYQDRQKAATDAGKATDDLTKKTEAAGSSASKLGDKGAQGSKKFTEETKHAASELDRLGNRIQTLGERIIAAYSIEKVIEFTTETVKASAAAELAAIKLDFSITKVLGGTKEQVKELKDQSEELTKTSFFSPRQITEAQNLQAQFGLTAEQIKKLTPLIRDLAVAQNTDLNSATETALKAIEGTSRGLKTVGADFKDSGNKVENFNILLGNLSKLQGAAANALDTTTGKLKEQEKQTEIIQEQIGNKLTPVFLAFKEAELDILSGSSEILTFFGKIVDVLNKLSNFQDPFLDFTNSVQGAKDNIENLIKASRGEFGDLGLVDLQKKLIATNSLLIDFSKQQKDAENGLDEAEKERTRRNLVDLFAQQQAVKQLIDEKKRQLDFENKIADANLSEGKELENLDKIKNGNAALAKILKDRFNTEIEIIKQRADAASVANKDEIDKREKAIKKIEDAEKEGLKKIFSDRDQASKKLTELDKKAREDDLIALGQDSIEKLQAEQKNKEAEILLTFNASQKQKQDEINRDDALLHIRSEFNAKIEDEEQKHLKHLEDLQNKFDAANKAESKAELDKKLLSIKDEANQEIRALQDAQTAKGDFSIQSESEIARKINEIQIKSEEDQIAILAKISDFDEAAAKEKIALEEDVSKRKSEIAKADYDLQKKLASQIEELSKSLVSALQQTLNNYYDAQAQRIEENNQKFLDSNQEQIDDNERKHSENKRGDRQYENEKKKLLDERTIAEKKADRELKKIKHDQAVYNRDIAILNATLSGIEGVARAFADYAYPYDIVVAAIVGALATAEITAAATTRIPSYYKGVEKITGKGTETSDDVPANLSVGERVVRASTNRKFFPILSAIHHERFDPESMNALSKFSPETLKAISQTDPQLLRELATMQPVFFKHLDFPAPLRFREDNSTQMKIIHESRYVSHETTGDGMNEHDMARALDRGTRIKNVKELAKEIGKEIVVDTNIRRAI